MAVTRFTGPLVVGGLQDTSSGGTAYGFSGLYCTGTANFKGAVTCSGAMTIAGVLTHRSTLILSNLAGSRKILTGGSSIVTNTLVTANSRIFLTRRGVAAANQGATSSPWVATVPIAGGSFKVKLGAAAGAGGTGSVDYLIVNSAA